MPAETDYAWAAGIVDGEGTIAMTRANPGVNRRKTLGFQVRINVRMTHEPTIRRLHAIFGGTCGYHKPQNAARHKPIYGWYVGDLLTVQCLRLMRAYLTAKRAQADLVLEFRERCFTVAPGKECQPDIAALRLSYFDRLTDMNRRGAVGALFGRTANAG